MAQTYYLTVMGSKQGAFEGEGGKKAKAKGVPLLGYSLGASVPHSSGSGQATGKREYEPLSVAKLVGPASTQFFQALVTNENLTSVELTIYKTGKQGKETAYFRVSLANAQISEFNHEPGMDFSGDPGETNEVETISFVFEKITLSNLATGMSVEDDLSAKV